MKHTIYIDVLIILNLAINYLLLSVTKKISNVSVKKFKLFLGALLGAMFSFVILMPQMNDVLLMMLKLMFSVAIVLVAFGFGNIKLFIKNTVIFYIVGFLFAGTMMGIWIFISPSNMSINNGMVYFNFSMATLLLVTVVIYIMLNGAIELYGKKIIKNMDYEVHINNHGKSVKLKGFLDTGNQLRDILTGKIVVVSTYDNVKTILTNDEKSELKSYLKKDFDNMKNVGKIKYIPFKSVEVGGMLPAVTIEEIIIKSKEHIKVHRNLLLAISSENMGNNSFDILLNSLLFTD